MAEYKKADEIYTIDFTDKRVVEYALREGLISNEEFVKEIENLPDLSADAELLEINEEEEIRIRAEKKEKRKKLAQAKKNLTN